MNARIIPATTGKTETHEDRNDKLDSRSE